MSKRNLVAKELFTPKFAKKVVPIKKGKGSKYNRKNVKFD